MSKLSFSQIEQLWTANGGSPTWAPTMAAVALVESGGSTTALNNDPSTGDYSVGLWQINYFGDLLQSRTDEFGTPANLQADPNAQAKAAIELLGNGAGITNWQGDAAAKEAINSGGPLSPSAAAVFAEYAGEGGSGGEPTTPAGLKSLTGDLNYGEGPRWLGLINPTRCVFGNFSFSVLGSVCIVDAAGARKIKGYTVMAIGGAGLLLGVVLVIAIGFKRAASTEPGRVATSLGTKVPGPIGTASRAARGNVQPRRAPTPKVPAPKTSQRELDDRQELADRRAEDERRRASQQSDQREREEGFGKK